MQQRRLQRLDPPLKAPVIAVHQTWHERFLTDPANLWLRQLVGDPFKSARRHAAAAPAASTR